MQRVPLNLEFIFKASPTILYKFLTTPNCLIRWFCDEVDVSEDKYTYSWSGEEGIAFVIDDIEDERLRFRWEDSAEDEILEYRLSVSPVTGETILEITDYCDDDEVDEQTLAWETQMNQLRSQTGG